MYKYMIICVCVYIYIYIYIYIHITKLNNGRDTLSLLYVHLSSFV